MLLPFTEGLTRVGKGYLKSCILADSHYSRQTPGANQFMPPGRTIVLRNSEGTAVFGWLWQDKRDDGQRGFNCSIFRNESIRQSSSIILEAEQFALDEWNAGGGRSPTIHLHQSPSPQHPKEARARVLPMATRTMLPRSRMETAHTQRREAPPKQDGAAFVGEIAESLVVLRVPERVGVTCWQVRLQVLLDIVPDPKFRT